MEGVNDEGVEFELQLMPPLGFAVRWVWLADGLALGSLLGSGGLLTHNNINNEISLLNGSS